jgi:hypothetical protein
VPVFEEGLVERFVLPTNVVGFSMMNCCVLGVCCRGIIYYETQLFVIFDKVKVGSQLKLMES